MVTYITDVTLRDAHQCLIATRMRTEDMLPVCKKMDSVGFWAMEVWGGATFDACLRYLKEDPWQRLRQLRHALPNTRLSMLLRGQNLLGYRHYADDVVDAFIRLAVKNGVDVFRVFDALNDVRNLQQSIRCIKKYKAHAQGAIAYTVSPIHNINLFVKMGESMAKAGCDSIAIKDMAGLLTPSTTVELYNELTKATHLPVHIHSHSTSGLASMCLYEAVHAGCQHIDTATSAFSGGASHPSTEAMVSALAGTDYDTGLDLNVLLDINDYFYNIRKKYHQFESDAQHIDPRVQLYQIPGGMISNLYNQLKEQQALDKIDKVHSEIPKVRKDLGYPPLVTPTSQVVGTQAVLNVLTGSRYETITNEVKLYCEGKYGASPAPIDRKLLKKSLGKDKPITIRPADLLPKELQKIKKDINSLAKNEEDILSFAMFPDIAKTFLEERQADSLQPEPLLETGLKNKSNTMSEFDLMLHGEQYHVRISGFGQQKGTAEQVVYLSVDGVPEEVNVHYHEPANREFVKSQSKIKRPGDVTVAMPGSVVNVYVQVGDEVQANQPLLVLEAMKMETEVTAPFAGIIEAVHCKKGDKVTPDKVLITLMSST